MGRARRRGRAADPRRNRGRAAGQEIELAGELVLGRGQDGSGALGTDIELSRRHARIAQGANGFFVEDLGSTNGTLRNGHAIDGPELLRDGDELELGSTRLAVRRRSARPRRLTLRIELDPVTRRVGIEIDDGTLLELDEGRWSLAGRLRSGGLRVGAGSPGSLPRRPRRLPRTAARAALRAAVNRPRPVA